MPTIAQTLTRQVRAAYRKGDQYEAGELAGYPDPKESFYDLGDFTDAPIARFFGQAVRYLDYQGDALACTGGQTAELTLYQDGSVAVWINPGAVHHSAGIFALTRKADLLAAKALLGPPPLPDCSLPPRNERHRAGSHCWVMISLGGRCQDCHSCDACGAPAVNHCSCGVHTCLACESKRNKERK